MSDRILSIELRVVSVEEGLPDADTDVLIFDSSHPEGQLGALICHGEGGPMWMDAQGEEAGGVTHWAEMPRLDESEPRGTAAAARPSGGCDCNELAKLVRAECEIERLREALAAIAQPFAPAPRDYMASMALAHGAATA
jgi:hypothetical protein